MRTFCTQTFQDHLLPRQSILRNSNGRSPFSWSKPNTIKRVTIRSWNTKLPILISVEVPVVLPPPSSNAERLPNEWAASKDETFIESRVNLVTVMSKVSVKYFWGTPRLRRVASFVWVFCGMEELFRCDFWSTEPGLVFLVNDKRGCFRLIWPLGNWSSWSSIFRSDG